MKDAISIIRFLRDAALRAERTALVTITDVIGSSSRETGTHMAISETGTFHGSFSGGCIEAAVVGEAKRVIDAGRAELIRFGAGSRFIDIRLPCGGGVDLLITPTPDATVLRQACHRLATRQSVSLALGRGGTFHIVDDSVSGAGWQGDRFVVTHQPDLRLVVIGHGAETLAMARLAAIYGAAVEVLSPDAAIVEAASRAGAQAWRLNTPARTAHLRTDLQTAVVMLFHDHDWETPLLMQALEQDAFFVGAMGSRATHRLRLESLRASGASKDMLDRLVHPFGLIPAARDPETLALSVLSHVVDQYCAAGQVRSMPPPIPFVPAAAYECHA